MAAYQIDVRFDLGVDECLLEEGEEVAWAYVEAELLEGLCEDCFVEEGVGGVGESCLQQVLVNEDVELVGPQYDRHYYYILEHIRKSIDSHQIIPQM